MRTTDKCSGVIFVGTLRYFAIFLSVHSVAENQDGFSLAVGPSAHYANVTVFNQSSRQVYESVGVGVYGDAQFVLDERWSLNPYLQTAWEHSHGQLNTPLLNSEGGLQLRRWYNNFYLGGALNFSSEQVLQHQGIVRADFGPGVSAVFGWENPDGLTYGLQLDAPQSGNGGVSHRAAVAVWCGYRWHQGNLHEK